MARTLAITYGSYVVGLGGTSSDVRPTDKVTVEQEYTSGRVSFEVMVLSSSASAFATVEAALVSAFRTPEQTLTVALGGQTRYSFSPASNTGFNTSPSIEKLAGVEDTDRSGRYRIEISFGLPASLAGKSGRQSASVSVRTDPAGIQEVTISGVYTALSGNSAREQYDAAIATYVAAVKSALSITDWELVGRPIEEDDHNGTALRFARVYREIFRNQGVGTTDVAGIVNPRLRIRRTDSATGDTTELGQTEPLRSMDLSYTCTVDKSVTTDLDSFYTSTIRPHLIAEAEALAGTGVIVQRESPNFDLFANRVYVDMDLLADVGTGLFSASVEVEDVISNGEVRFVVWDGNPYSRDVYQGPKAWIRRIRKSVLRRAGTAGISELLSIPTAEFRENSQVRKTSTRELGRQAGGVTVPLEFTVVSQEFERVDRRGGELEKDFFATLDEFGIGIGV